MCKRIIFVLLIFSTFVFGQNSLFDTHAVTLKGELTKEDIYEKDFGRFDAYELNMEEGDLIYLSLKAEFFPLMIIVAPSSEYKMAFPKDNNPIVNYKTEIDESGLWYIYIAGDSLDAGSHTLDICYVSKNSKELPSDADFLTLIKFFLAHSVTDFDFFKKETCVSPDGTWKIMNDSKSIYKSAVVNQKGSVSNVTISLKSDTDKFNRYTDILRTNFKKEWNLREDKKSKVVKLTEIEGLRKMTLKDEGDIIVFSISNK